MALTLPTVTVNDPNKEARLLAAFKPTPTSTNAEAAAAYKQWLVKAITQEVIQREVAALRTQTDADVQQAAQELSTLMDGST